MKVRAFFALSISVLLLSLPIHAQQYPQSIHGIVHDAGGTRISDARIMLINQETGTTRVVSANEKGEFTFSLILAGTHKLVIEEEGFQKYTREIKLLPNQQVNLNIRLKPPKPKSPVPYVAKSQ